MEAIHAGILAGTATYDLALSEEELWLAEQQVPTAWMTGTIPTGRNLLLKVMAAIQELQVQEAREEPVVLSAAVEGVLREVAFNDAYQHPSTDDNTSTSPVA